MYDTIHNSPVLLSFDFPKLPGMLAGRVVLVDRGGQYVVSEQYRDEGTNELQDGWGQGNYFPHVGRASHLPPQEEALAAALVKYTEMVQRRKSMAQAA